MRTLAPLALALVVGCQCGTAPTVIILAPADGTTLVGPGPFVVSGQVTDPEELIPDERISWSSDREGVVGKGADAIVALAPGPHRLALEAIDSSGQVGAAEISVFVRADTGGEVDGGSAVDAGFDDAGVDAGADLDPVVTITAPLSGAVFDQGQPIELVGSATDVPDGLLTGGQLVWTSAVVGVIGSGERVTFSNAALGVHQLVLSATDRTGHTGLASVSVTVVRPGTNRPPAVTISAPLAGAVLTVGTPVVMQGAAVDPEDGALAGASLRWASSVTGNLGTGASVTATLPQGVHTLTLTATDSMGAAASASVVVSVNQPNNQPPAATITQPVGMQTIFEGASLGLAGSGVDPEDGALTGTALSWSSSRDGLLGTGSTLTVSALTVGDHVITLTARDSGGNTGTATLSVRVLAMNRAPTVVVTAPATGASVVAGASVAFTASANDPEDGALTGASVRWTSSRDGSLGTGAALTTSALSVGVHTITVTATDSGGRSASASITFTVTMAATNVPPLARLTGPTTGQVGQTLAFDGSTSTDSDGTVVSYAFDFGDASMAMGASATHAFSMAGTFTVRLTVTDNRGGTGSATLVVVIAAPVHVPTVVSATNADVGSACAIATPGSRVFLAWTTTRHPGLRFGEYVGGVLQEEVVDALGFGTGGLVGQHVSMRVEANGTPHLSYVRDSVPFYATKQGGVWLRERVDASLPTNGATGLPSVALNGSAPVVLYDSFLSGTGTRPVLATRTGANTWSATVLTGSTGFIVGDMAIDGAGRATFPLYSGISNVQLASVVLPATTMQFVSLFGTNTTPARLRMAVAGTRLFTVGAPGVFQTEPAANFSASVMTRSTVETFQSTQHAIAADPAGLPRVLVVHSGELEHLWVSSTPEFWRRESLGPVDNGQIAVSVDGANATRGCFVRAGKLMLY